ncbi:MAG: RHS repeat-associated core domain-containing protein [archaeon]
MKNGTAITLVVTLIVLFLVNGCQLTGEAKSAVALTQSVADEPQARVAVSNEEHYIYGIMLEAKYSEEGLRYIHQDVLGSSRAITNTDGKIEENTHLPYGQSLGASSERFTFTGKEAEGELAYYGARYYDPDSGRFTQKDPIQNGKNWYTYANNNPIKFKDKTGLEGESVAFVIWDEAFGYASQEARQYAENYRGRFDQVILRGVHGRDEFSAVVGEANALIEQGANVERVNFFYDFQDGAFGIKRGEWHDMPVIHPQEGRQSLMFLGYGLNQMDTMFHTLAITAGSESFVGAKSWHSISPFPVEDDMAGFYTIEQVNWDDLTYMDLYRFAKNEPNLPGFGLSHLDFAEGESTLLHSFSFSVGDTLSNVELKGEMAGNEKSYTITQTIYRPAAEDQLLRGDIIWDVELADPYSLR